MVVGFWNNMFSGLSQSLNIVSIFATNVLSLLTVSLSSLIIFWQDFVNLSISSDCSQVNLVRPGSNSFSTLFNLFWTIGFSTSFN